jgi:hypothetical protein
MSRAGDAFDAFEAAWSCDQSGRYATTRPVMIHGRTATCGVSLSNVHPFEHSTGWRLAHNGVVSWTGDESPEHSGVSCDSQHLLLCMADGRTTDERKTLLEGVQGYAAFLATSPRGDFIAARDDIAPLYAGVTKNGRWIFGTTPAIVDAIADAMRARGVDAFKLDDWTWLEFSAGGTKPRCGTWHHAAPAAREWGYSSKSLGKPAPIQPSLPLKPAPATTAPATVTHGDPFPDWEPRANGCTLPDGWEDFEDTDAEEYIRAGIRN